MLSALVVSMTALAAMQAPASPPSPRFRVVIAGQEATIGSLTSADPQGGLKLADRMDALPWDRLVSIRTLDTPVPAWPRDQGLILTSGDRIRGAIRGGDSKGILIAPRNDASGEPWTIPYPAIAAVWFIPAEADLNLDPKEYPWADRPGRRDALLMRNGDVLMGTLEGMTSSPPAVRWSIAEGKSELVQFARLAAISFDPALSRIRPAKGKTYRIVTTDGSRVTVNQWSLKDGSIKATTMAGAAWTFPVSNLVSIDVIRGPAVWLSELTPKTESQPYLGLNWQFRVDRSVKGTPLQVLTPRGVETFDRGIGTHPKTTLTYTLAGKYRRFETIVGLDRQSGIGGAAIIRIRVDGKEQSVGGEALLDRGVARELSIDVSGAKTLTLEVDFGPRGDVRADVDWCEARLIE